MVPVTNMRYGDNDSRILESFMWCWWRNSVPQWHEAWLSGRGRNGTKEILQRLEQILLKFYLNSTDLTHRQMKMNRRDALLNFSTQDTCQRVAQCEHTSLFACLQIKNLQKLDNYIIKDQSSLQSSYFMKGSFARDFNYQMFISLLVTMTVVTSIRCLHYSIQPNIYHTYL